MHASQKKKMKKCVDASSVRGGGARGPPRPPHPPRPHDANLVSPPPAPQPSSPRAAAARGTARRNVSYAKNARREASRRRRLRRRTTRRRRRRGLAPRVAVAERERREPGRRDTHGACVRHRRALRGRCAPPPRAWCSSAPPNAAAPRRPAATASPSSPRPVFPEKNPSPKNRPPARVFRATFEREAAFASSLMIFSVSTELRSLRSRVSRLFLPGSSRRDRRAAGSPSPARRRASARPRRRASR